jgi:hypothetical protein
MNDLKHSKGPWEFNGHRQVVFQGAERYRDCDLWDVQYDDKEEMIANAKLIAAAPTMLQALVAIKTSLTLGIHTVDKSILEIIDKAIKKATE